MTDATLFVADSINLLADGKPMAMGLYTDRRVLLTDPAVEALLAAGRPAGLTSFYVMLGIAGAPPGDYTVPVGLVGPGGRPWLGEVRDAQLKVSVTGSANLIIGFTPFVFDALGEYTVTARLGGAEIGGNFFIEVAPPELQRPA